MVLHLPLDECIDNTHTKVTREKRKRKQMNKKKLQQAIESQTKGKEQDHLKKTSLGPLRQGQQLDTSETKTKLKQRAQTTKPKLKHHKELPLHTCKLPLNESMQTS
jgi:hypothetical protein